MDEELQEYRQSNLAVESKMIKLRSEVTSLENQLHQEEKEISAIQQQNESILSYLSVLKKEVLGILGTHNLGAHLNLGVINEDNVETCINQLQTLCNVNRNGGGESGGMFYNAVNIAVSQIQVA